MKRSLFILFTILISAVMLVSCGNKKKDIHKNTEKPVTTASPASSPAPTGENPGVDFNDLTGTGTPGKTSTKSPDTANTPKPEKTPSSETTKTPGTADPTDIPDYDDDNWSGLY